MCIAHKPSTDTIRRAKHDSHIRRASAFWLFGTFCAVTELDFSLYRIDWIRLLVSSLDDGQSDVVSAAWVALDSFVKAVPKDEYEGLVPTLRRAIESTGSPGHTVAGFNVHKGVGPLVPVIIAGLTTGSSDQRESAAAAIGDIVERTEEAALKPYVVPFTGPLIRVATQAGAFPPGVKGAILGSLSTMLERIPALVKNFFPQLQRTFVKAASDPSSLAVRAKAAHALGVLMRSQTRVDPVVTELVGSVRATREGGDEAVAASLVTALAAVAKNCGTNLGQGSKDLCLELLKEGFRDGGDGSCLSSSSRHWLTLSPEYYTQGIATLFASLARFPDLLQSLTQCVSPASLLICPSSDDLRRSHLVAGTPTSVAVSQTILTVLNDEPELFHDPEFPDGTPASVARKVMSSIGDERPGVSRPAREARETMRSVHPWASDDAVRAVVG